MKNILRSAIVVFALLLADPALSATQTFSWQECVDLAINNNSDLKAAIALEKTSNYQKNAAISGFLPQVSANLSSNRNDTNNSALKDSYSTSISATQNLFSGFQDVAKFNQAKANNLASRANVALVKAQISYDLKLAYENLSYAKESVALLDDIIRRRQDNLNIIELRFKGGMENKGSLLLAKAYLEQAQFDRLQATNAIESAKAQLCKVIGLDKCEADNFDIRGPVPISEAPKEKIDFAAIIENTPKHQQIKAQELAAKYGITIAKSEFFPDLDVTLAKGLRGSGFFPQDDYWSVGMNLSVPFFTGGKDYYTTRGAYENSAAAKAKSQSTDQQILVELNQNYSAYIEAISKLKVDKNFKDASALRAEIARNKYNNGLLSFENWDNIETDLINRQKAYLVSKKNRVITQGAWEQAQGKGIFSNL